MEALFTTLLVEVFEGRDVATFDIPGAYLHAEIPEDKTVILKLKGKFVRIMCEINLEYKQHARIEGKKVSCICLCYGHCMVVLNLHYSGIFYINPLSKKKVLF